MQGGGYGSYRELVTIQSDAAATNDPDPSYSSTLYSGVPCSITDVSGDETFRGRKLDAGISYVVEMHRLTGVQPDMRLSVTGGQYNSRTLHIAHVRDMAGDGTPHKMQLYCRELVA